MKPAVIDTSVVMCVLLGEPGADNAARVSQGATISSVNLAEVVAKCIERDVAEALPLLFLRKSDATVLDFDLETARLAGRLWKEAPKGKLSLGDRACIATAIRTGGVAVTADRIWATFALPCPVELIR